jgi:hypothetical protein
MIMLSIGKVWIFNKYQDIKDFIDKQIRIHTNMYGFLMSQF